MKKIALIVLIVIFGIHFSLRFNELNDYNEFPGKIIGFTDVNARQVEKNGVSYIAIKIPVVEYINGKGDKLIYVKSIPMILGEKKSIWLVTSKRFYRFLSIITLQIDAYGQWAFVFTSQS